MPGTFVYVPIGQPRHCVSSVALLKRDSSASMSAEAAHMQQMKDAPQCLRVAPRRAWHAGGDVRAVGSVRPFRAGQAGRHAGVGAERARNAASTKRAAQRPLRGGGGACWTRRALGLPHPVRVCPLRTQRARPQVGHISGRVVGSARRQGVGAQGAWHTRLADAFAAADVTVRPRRAERAQRGKAGHAVVVAPRRAGGAVGRPGGE